MRLRGQWLECGVGTNRQAHAGVHARAKNSSLYIENPHSTRDTFTTSTLKLYGKYGTRREPRRMDIGFPPERAKKAKRATAESVKQSREGPDSM